MQTLRANGAEFEYQTVGTGEPLVLIHGSMIGDGFAPLVDQKALTDRYQVTDYHRRGFLGSSRHAGPFSIPQQANDALAIIQHVAGGRAHVAGHSYGAATLLQLALDAPEAVETLSLLEPPLPVPSAEAFFAGIPQIAALYEAGDRAGAVDAFLAAAFGPGEYNKANVGQHMRADWHARAVVDVDTFFQVELPAIGEWNFTGETARRIAKPVLSVLGANSSEFFIEGDALIRDWFPQAETFVLPGASHTLQMENPRGLADALIAFLVKHPMRVAVPA